MKNWLIAIVIIVLIGGGVWYFLFRNTLKNIDKNPANSSEVTKEMKITSPKFSEGEMVPIEYTCDDENINPPLTISEVPREAKSLVLLLEDPDAPLGTFTHWVLWNISPNTTEIKERETPAGSVSGKNDFNQDKYKGPCPPNGTHRYFFKIYALDSLLNLPQGSYKEDVVKAMQGHIIAQGELAAKYSRYQTP